MLPAPDLVDPGCALGRVEGGRKTTDVWRPFNSYSAHGTHPQMYPLLNLTASPFSRPHFALPNFNKQTFGHFSICKRHSSQFHLSPVQKPCQCWLRSEDGPFIYMYCSPDLQCSYQKVCSPKWWLFTTFTVRSPKSVFRRKGEVGCSPASRGCPLNKFVPPPPPSPISCPITHCTYIAHCLRCQYTQ